MLRLLLDEHLSPAIARQLVARNPDLVAFSMRSWDAGTHLGEADQVILAAARAQELTLVTFDLRTIPPLLKAWAETGVGHGGVVFVDTRSLAPSDKGALVLALERLWQDHGSEEWQDRVVFLTG